MKPIATPQTVPQTETDIAFLCGFNSHSHLSKQFRQLTGMAPKVYREKCDAD